MITDIVGQRVFVYYNLHKKCWSVRSKATGRVIYHTNTIHLQDITCKVSEAGRLRVLKEQRKNVHAGIEGTVWAPNPHRLQPHTWEEITYNPYKYETFVHKTTQEPVYAGWAACMSNRQVWVTNPQGR